VPYVAPVPGMTPEAYVSLIERRFANPAIRDTTRRVAFDGSSRHTGFVLPILPGRLAAGGSVNGLPWWRRSGRACARARARTASRIEPNDPQWRYGDPALPVTRPTPDAVPPPSLRRPHCDVTVIVRVATTVRSWLTT
jgi:mannitol 2-dehydrogenase